jgi:Subtilase family
MTRVTFSVFCVVISITALVVFSATVSSAQQDDVVGVALIESDSALSKVSSNTNELQVNNILANTQHLVVSYTRPMQTHWFDQLNAAVSSFNELDSQLLKSDGDSEHRRAHDLHRVLSIRPSGIDSVDISVIVTSSPNLDSRIAELEALTGVQSVSVAADSHRLSSQVRSLINSPPAALLSDSNTLSLYTVLVHDSSSPAYSATNTLLEQAGAQLLRRDGDHLRINADSQSAAIIASSPLVVWMETYEIPSIQNEVAAGTIMRASIPYSHDPAYNGSSVIVGVADSGCGFGGGGDGKTIHAHLPTTRVQQIQHFVVSDAADCYTVISDGAEDRESGHGTHVLMSVVSGGYPDGVGRGSAPESRLVCQAVSEYLSTFGSCAGSPSKYYLLGIPSDLNVLFGLAYDQGARIHTNSWGSSSNVGSYSQTSADVDKFMWDNKDILILYSAGNNGADANADGIVDDDSIGTPGTAKNCLTVGASENVRSDNYPCDTENVTNCGGFNTIFTYGQAWPTTYPTAPLNGDPTAGNSQQLAAFSSRGPTDDGRIKPDVVAPGTWILSGYSPLYRNGIDPVPNPINGQYQSYGWGYPYDDLYKYNSGTSMSTPLTAGGAAVVSDFLTKKHSHSGSGALIKGILVNTAVDLLDENNDGVDDNDFPIPNSHEGWGMVDLGAATDDELVFYEETTGLTTGNHLEYTAKIHSWQTASPFKVTLSYSDYPAAASANPTLINNLDLIVTSPTGTVYRGNVFAGGWSQTGGTADTVNNLENVYVQNPELGTYTIRVEATSVTVGPQPYAVVVTGTVEGCSIDSDCTSSDDGLFCNGAEVCNTGTHTCESAGDPCAANGTHPVCLESASECVECTAENDAFCGGLFCDGADSCNVASNTCEHAGNPCVALVTTPFCDENLDQCVSAFECKNNMSEPTVPTYQVVTQGSFLLLTLNFSREFDVGVNVSFPNSDNGYCDFSLVDPDGNPLWQLASEDPDQCLGQVVLNVSTSDMLSKCGFQQDTLREAGRTHFLNTIDITTEQLRLNLLREEYVVSRSHSFMMDLSVATNVTAAASISVRGVPVYQDLLADLRIEVVGDGDGGYLYYVRGLMLTDLQWPYRLQDPTHAISSNFVDSSFNISVDSYCNEVDGNTAEDICLQAWSFEMQIDPSVACISHTELADWFNLTLEYNCSDHYPGECNPTIGSGVAAFELFSPNYCPELSSIALDADVVLYAYAPTGGSSGSSPASDEFLSTSQNSPGADFTAEGVFVYESTVFGEVTAAVPDGAATLGSTSILSITTKPAGYSSITVYNDLANQAAGVSGGDVVVTNTGFGVSETQPSGVVRDYDNAHARFQFTWNANTVNRDNSESSSADGAQSVAIEVLVEVTFAEASVSSEDNDIITELAMQNRFKTRRSTLHLFAAETDFPADFAAVTIATVTNSAPVGASSSSSAMQVFGMSATVAGVAVVSVLVVITALAVVVRRHRHNKSSQEQDEGVELHGITDAGMVASATNPGIPPTVFPDPTSLETVHDLYVANNELV